MIFVKWIKPYRVISKYIKNVGEEVLSIGFPISELGKDIITTEIIEGAIGATKIEQLDKRVIFSAF